MSNDEARMSRPTRPAPAVEPSRVVEGLEARRMFASAAAVIAAPQPPPTAEGARPLPVQMAVPARGAVAAPFGGLPGVRFFVRPIVATDSNAPRPAEGDAGARPDVPNGFGAVPPRGEPAAAVRPLPVQATPAGAASSDLPAPPRSRAVDPIEGAAADPTSAEAVGQTTRTPAADGTDTSRTTAITPDASANADGSGATGDGTDVATLAEPTPAAAGVTSLAVSWSAADAIVGAASAPSATGVFADTAITPDVARDVPSAAAPADAVGSASSVLASVASSAARLGSSVLGWSVDDVRPSGDVASGVAAVAGVAVAAYWLVTSRGEQDQEPARTSSPVAWGLAPVEPR